MSKYLGPIKYLGTAAVLVFLFGRVFAPLSKEIFSEDTRDGVLVRAIPFVTIFISIILLYILLIFMIAIRFNGKIPYRTYRPIELTIVAGILIGIACLFQPWQIIGYEYGFLVLLGSTVGFILWSHVVPQSAAAGKKLKPFELWQHVVAGVLALVVMGGLVAYLVDVERPAPPYGIRPREWEFKSARDPEFAQQVKEDAENEFESEKIPVLLFLSIFPGITVYAITREVLASFLGEAMKPLSKTAPAASGSQ